MTDSAHNISENSGVPSHQASSRETMSRETFEQRLVQFIAGPLAERRGLNLDNTVIDVSTPLFQDGLIDSMAILDLLAFVEKTTQQSIPTHRVDMQYFGTVAAICETFWHEEMQA